jgi:hypothetical protein
MNYYDIDNIIAQEEKLKVKFPYNIKNFGFYINPNTSDIKMDTHVDLPYFLVKFLLENDYCSLVENPLNLIKNELDAAPRKIDLKNRNFYNLNKFINDKVYLSDIFYQRMGSYASLMEKQSFNEDDMAIMSYEEKKIMLSSEKTFKLFKQFKLKNPDDASANN